MTPEVDGLDLGVLQLVVTLAKDHNVSSPKRLVELAMSRGISKEDAQTALLYWGDHLRARYPDIDTLRDSMKD